MKKRKVLIISTAAVAVAFAGLAITVHALGTRPTAAEPAASPPQYIVRAERGRVSVYPEGSALPEFDAGIDFSGLREYDRKLLERGIVIEGHENMIALLEDFSN